MKELFAPRGWAPGSPGFVGLVFLASALAGAIYSWQAGFDLNWDLRNYHLYGPHAMLEGRWELDTGAAQVQTYLNPASFVPYYLATMHAGMLLVGILFGALHGLSVGLVFLLARTVLRGVSPRSRELQAGAIALLAFWGPLFREQLGASYNDILLLPLVLLPAWILVRELQRQGEGAAARLAPWLVAGALAGLATGLKLVFAAWLLALLAGVVVTAPGLRGSLRCALIFGGGALAGLLLGGGPWAWSLWQRFESPLFPFYNRVFGSPLYVEHNFADLRFLPRSWGEAVRIPLEMSDGRVGLALGALAVAGLLLLLGAARRYARSRQWGPWASSLAAGELRATVFLAVFLVVGLVAWEAKFSIERYALPLECLAPLVVVASARALGPRWARWASPALLLVLAVLVLRGPPPAGDRFEWRAGRFHVEVPRFDAPGEVMVVLAEDRPMSYLIPFFQPEVRFVHLWSNLTRPRENFESPRIHELALERVRAHDGELYALSTQAPRKLARYGIGPPDDELILPIRWPQDPATGPGGDVLAYKYGLFRVQVVPEGQAVQPHRRPHD